MLFNMVQRSYLLAFIILFFMGTIALFSMRGDSSTMDELSHLPAGYSYVTQQDMRINPEHPPLVKDLAGLPLLLIPNIQFPFEVEAWTKQVNGQWDFGRAFFYGKNNPVDLMLFWGRIPLILIMLLLGYYVFRWCRELFGDKAALGALILYAFSPTVLAHGRLVTTDVAAGAGAFIAMYYFVRFLKKTDPEKGLRENIRASKYELLKGGIALGIAELFKFSLILLLPTFALLTFLWLLIKTGGINKFLKSLIKYSFLSVIGLSIAYTLVWGVYQYHVWNYPPERQKADTEYILAPETNLPEQIAVWMADKPILRPLGQYFLGLLMVFQRASGGNTGYFLGEISNLGWKSYFPVVYFLKEPLPFFILMGIALGYFISRIIKRNTFSRESVLKRLFSWLEVNFSVVAMLVFVTVYWVISLQSNLNIGVRHLLPVFPFTILLVAAGVVFWAGGQQWRKYLVGGLMIWQIFSVLWVYPSFLAYFSDIIGGPSKGYQYVVDSNLDWGQDLKRLSFWVEKHAIDEIYVDYFGGGDPQYYLGDKFKAWWGQRSSEDLPSGSYLAVSATFLQGGRGEATREFIGKESTGHYKWLDDYEPVARIGYSIFVFRK